MSNGLRSSADTATRRPTAPGRGSSSRRSGNGAGRGGRTVRTLIALAIVAGSYYAAQANSGNSSTLGWSLAGGTSSGPVKVSGYAGGLYPGARSYLRVKVKNGSSRRVTMTRIRVRVGRGAEGCPSRTLRIGGFTGRRRIGVDRNWRLNLPLTMLPWAGDACQGARYPLLFVFRASR